MRPAGIRAAARDNIIDKIRQNHIYPSTLQSICQGNDQPITWGTAPARERKYNM